MQLAPWPQDSYSIRHHCFLAELTWTDSSGDSERDLETTRVPDTTSTPDGEIEFPQFPNGVIVYGFPVVFVVGVATNALSFLVILNSSLRKASTGLYLCVLAVADSVCLTLWTSITWAVLVLGRNVQPLDSCNVKDFSLSFFFGLSSMCVVCVTTDRFLVVWFPLQAKKLTTRKRAACVMVSVTLILLLLFLPALFAVSPNCEVNFKLHLYSKYAYFTLTNIVYSFGPAIYLLCLNIAISIKLLSHKAAFKGTGSEQSRQKQSRIVVTVLLVSIAFIVCCMPFNLLVALQSAGLTRLNSHSSAEIVYTLCRFLSLLNHSINFFLYVLSSANFRRCLVALFTRPCQRSPLSNASDHISEIPTSAITLDGHSATPGPSVIPSSSRF